MSAPTPPDDGGQPFNLLDRFPDMVPIQGVPSLQTVNGVGTSMAGRRDFDDETNTYVKTHTFTFLFIPLLALGAYRVADAPGGGWYFLGKVPLSGFARTWNKVLGLLALLGVCWIGWHFYTISPDFKAATRLAEGDALAKAGQGTQAAEVYREVLFSGHKADDARKHLDDLLTTPPGSLSDTAGVYRVALELVRQERGPFPDLFARAAKLAQQGEERDPKGALELLETVAPLAANPADHQEPRRRMLERLAADAPDDVDLASRLGVVCAEQNDRPRCLAVLSRHEKALGARDGATILAQLYVAQNKLDQARALLTAYLDARLPEFRADEAALRQAHVVAESRAKSDLMENKAKDFDFERFKKASPDEQGRMQMEYFDRRLGNDAALRDAGRRIGRHRGVVPAAIDLGMLLLLRAQGLAEPDARQAELKLAEERFLSVQGFAKDSDNYRLSLGQVYYWLGKPADGRKLFDEFLAAHKDDGEAEAMIRVAQVLREVGADSEARTLAEQAYAREPDANKKQAYAVTRSVLFTDLDDQILWLSRADASLLPIKAGLCRARGQKALAENQEAEAIAQLKEALAVYAKMPDSIGTLNNSALVHFDLYNLTQDPEQFTRGADKLERAVAQKPGDSILLANAAGSLLDAMSRDLIGPAVDWKVLKRGAGMDLFSYLYADKAGRDRFVVRLKSHPGLAKARAYFEKLLLLAPRRADNYSAVEGIADYLGDAAGLRAVAKRLAEVTLDQEQYVKETRDTWAGKRDEKAREDAKKALARQEETYAAAKKVGGVTLAVAACRLASTRTAAAALDVPVEVDTVVQLAKEADAAAPSAATKTAVIEALAFRAHRALLRDDKAYAELGKRTHRSLGSQLLTWVLSTPGPLRDKALANADVKDAMKLKAAQLEAFPDFVSGHQWAFLVAGDPAAAAKLVERAKKDPLHAVKVGINEKLGPLTATAILEAYWTKRMLGQTAEAEAYLREQAKKGVPLPAGGG